MFRAPRRKPLSKAASIFETTYAMHGTRPRLEKERICLTVLYGMEPLWNLAGRLEGRSR